MASALMEKTSHTLRVANDLERQIATGILPPLTKIKSIRDLAKQYGVSKNIVLAALKELDKKRLIHREARKGIFVSEMAANPKMMEVLALLFKDNPIRSPFSQQILSAISSPQAAGKINFYIRVATHAENDENPPEYWTRLLEAEIAKLSHTFHSDCALVVGTQFLRKDIENILKLPFPTLLVGNFLEGDYPDLNYNRLGQSANYHDVVVNYAARQQMKNIIFFYQDVLKNASYGIEAQKRLEKQAAARNIKVHVIPIENTRHAEEKVWMAGLRKGADKAAELGIKEGLCYFYCMIHQKELISLLVERGFKPEKDKLEVVNNPTVKMFIRDEWMRYVILPQKELDGFNDHLISTLKRLCRGEVNNYIEDYYLDYEII